MRSARSSAASAIGVAIALGVATARADVPREGDCPAPESASGAEAREDAIAVPIRPGDAIGYEDLARVRALLPAEVWGQRSAFFSVGMRMAIGPCQRRYPVARHHADATARFADRVRLDADGNLHGYVAGTPFPPRTIADGDPAAGAKWAWNLEYRYRGAGPRGRFRIADIPTRAGDAHEYTGAFFQLRTAHRADLGASDHALAGSDSYSWIGGGRFDEPSESRHLAWRQMRPRETDQGFASADETFVYVPAMRKMRRPATAWIDGLYTPAFRVGSSWAGGSVAADSNALAPTRAVSVSSSLAAATTEHLPVGFNDLSIRPNAYRWRWVGEREVLAPINAERAGYPQDLRRNFGTSGLAVGSDRWEARHAVVIEGEPRDRARGFERLTAYVDHDTQLPLYLITRRRDGRIVDVGIPIHRFSGDIAGYPSWPDGERALIFDPVAAVYTRVADGGGGWRREAYDVRSTPPSAEALLEMTSTDPLLRGR